MHQRLAAVDPASAQRIHPNHSQRLGRALEVYLCSGVSMSEWHRRQELEGQPLLAEEFAVHQLAICPADRGVLHARIEKRLSAMIDAGLEDEVRSLYQRGDLHPDLPAMRAVGYRQMWEYVRGGYDLEQAVERALFATRQLAKRQLTWLRGWSQLQWIYTNSAGYAANSVENLEKSRETPFP